VLAALNGLSIDNAEIHVYGDEVPILDGSARLVVEALHRAGTRIQNAVRKVARIAGRFSWEENGKSIDAVPYEGFRVDYTIRFPHPAIGEQHFALDVTPASFTEQIADARTFGFLKEVEYLHSRGLARGGSLENVIVVGDNGVINKEGLRFMDEFVRHKILDFIGDMAMLGMPMLGAFKVACSGHAHNNAFLRRLVQNKDALIYGTC
jgi:UDP-3-O-[3-hydroxymyristoyl] N-acetylglucosamine deacetylase